MKKAQKILALFLAAILMVMSFAACGNTSEDAASNAADSTAESPLKVVYYVSGQLGDKSFFDSNGIRRRTDKGYATCYGSGQEKYGNSALTRKNSCAG